MRDKVEAVDRDERRAAASVVRDPGMLFENMNLVAGVLVKTVMRYC